MFDKTFGEITYDYSYVAKKEILFFHKKYEIEIRIDANEEEKIAQIQRDTYEALMNNWINIQHKIVDAILTYYNETEKGSYGPNNLNEFKKWWPEISTKEELIEKIHLTSIIIRNDYIIEAQGKNPIYILFDRDWGGDDLEDNGVAVFIENGEISKIGYKNIAF